MLEIKVNSTRVVDFKSWIFPGGEIGFSLGPEAIEKLEHDLYCNITARIQSSNDLLELVSCVDAVNRLNNGNFINLFIPYFPGARQDRVSNVGEPLSLKLYADIINNLRCHEVEIVDPHSDCLPILIEDVRIYPIEDTIKKVIKDCNPDYIISPDAGASKRIEKYLLKIGCELPVIQCLKKRDTKTGKLSGFQVCEPAHLMRKDESDLVKKVLMLDDIIDGAGTYCGLADTHPLNQCELYLYATHGIFSKGYKELLKRFEKVYTTDSFIPKEPPPEQVVVYKLYDNN